MHCNETSQPDNICKQNTNFYTFWLYLTFFWNICLPCKLWERHKIKVAKWLCCRLLASELRWCWATLLLCKYSRPVYCGVKVVQIMRGFEGNNEKTRARREKPLTKKNGGRRINGRYNSWKTTKDYFAENNKTFGNPVFLVNPLPAGRSIFWGKW